ncbi:MAG: DUF3857 domain-containing protein [Algicola sp.]|nr:DUF3857 domain-containing protein [Algicola sp.]
MNLTIKLLINTVFLFALSMAVQAADLDPDKIGFSPVPTWVELAPMPATINTDEPLDVLYVLFDQQVNINRDKKVSFSRLSQKVMNQQGLAHAAKLEIGFAPAYQKILIHELHVLRDNKKLDRLVKDNIKLFQQETALDKGMYQEVWQALVILDDIRVGDIVQYSYSVVGSNPVLGDKHFGTAFLDWGVPLQNYHYKLISPAGEHLSYQLENTQVKVQDTTNNGVRVLEINQTNVAPVLLEDRFPSWFNPYGTFEYTQYKNWQQVNDWAMTLYPVDQALPDELKALLAKQHFDNKLDAVTFVTQWIQDNVRYFGIETGTNSHRPSKPGETLTRRYGDCKDKTVLLNTALRHLDIDATPALVSTVLTHSLNKRLPSPGAFNHVISYFHYQGKDHWVDATMSGQKGPVTENSFPDLKWGFVVKPGSSGLTSMKPVSTKQTSAVVDIEETLTVGDNGKPSILNVKTRYSGWKARQMRSYMSSTGATTATQDHLNFYTRYFDNIEAENPLKVTEVANNELLIESAYRIKDAAKAVAGRNEVTLYASTIIDEIQPPQVRQRKYPYALTGELEINHRLNIVPSDMNDVIWRGEVAPVEIKSPWFDYSVAVNKNEQGIAVDFRYKTLTEQVRAKDFATYLNKLDEIDKSLAYSVWLRKDRDQRSRDRKKDVRNLLQSLMKKS